jgi:hypothetical protein
MEPTRLTGATIAAFIDRAARDRAELVVPAARADKAGRAVPGVQAGVALRQPVR